MAPLLLVAAAMASVICWEIWSQRLAAPYQWLTRARYPRGFPLIVGFQLFVFLGFMLLLAV